MARGKADAIAWHYRATNSIRVSPYLRLLIAISFTLPFPFNRRGVRPMIHPPRPPI